MTLSVEGGSMHPIQRPEKSVAYDHQRMIMIGGDIYELDTKQKPLWGTVLQKNIRDGNGGKLLKSWFVQFPKETLLQSQKGSLSPALKNLSFSHHLYLVNFREKYIIQ